MKAVSARQANHEFSELLSRVEPRRGNPDHQTEQAGRGLILLSPNRPPLMTAERKKAIQHAIDVMAKGLSWRPTKG
jgi:antitoxin (DNA-binding transcriptional repressor) of toxin-antitoxin stability system